MRSYRWSPPCRIAAAVMMAATVTMFCGCTKKTAPPPTTSHDVIVVGAGLAGLSAAYQLQKTGLDVLVLEERSVLGGRVATAVYGAGVTGEYGMQEIWEDSPLLALAHELNVPLDAPESAFSSCVIDGNLIAFTQSTSSAYLEALLGAPEAAALDTWLDHAKTLYTRAREVGLADPNVAHLQDISFAAWLSESHLAARTVQWVRLTVEGELASEAETFSALSALLDMEMFFGPGEKNYHVQGGNSQVVEALARPLGDRLRMHAQVTGLRRTLLADGTPQVTVRYEEAHRVAQVTAKRVVLAVPSTRVHQLMMEPPLPADYWLAINSLRFGHYVVVHFLAPSSARNLVDSATFPVLAGGPLGVVYGLDHSPEKSTSDPPSPSQDVFGLLIYGEPARQFHMVPRETRVADIRARLQKHWPAYTRTLTDAFVYSYHPSALPVWPPGRSSIDALSTTLRTPHMGVYLAGDYTQGAHATGAVASGLAAARAIIAELR